MPGTTRILLATILVLPLCISTGKAGSGIKADEEIIFFPSNAFEGKKDSWKIRIHGWVFEPASDLKRVFYRLFRLKPSNEAEKRLYRRRSKYFLVDNERGKIIRIRLNGNTYQLQASGSNGHFRHSLLVQGPLTASPGAREPGLRFQALLQKNDPRKYNGKILLVNREGLSVISDVDDTIKISNVLNKKELMKNTFLRPFVAAPGMSGLYARLQKKGAVFHYVSASPWQLYPPLEKFRARHGFPLGSFHLKTFRWRDRTFTNVFKSSVKYKTGVIEGLIQDSPDRRFILVGDSGEHDPEIYGAIARRYPARIAAIWIRNIKNEKRDSVRFKQAFRDISPGLWKLLPPEKIHTGKLIKLIQE